MILKNFTGQISDKLAELEKIETHAKHFKPVVKYVRSYGILHVSPPCNSLILKLTRFYKVV